MKPTFAVITPVLFEHKYLNYFIEYHLNLGFDKIYILIDNTVYEQNEYQLKNNLKDKVIFYYIRDFYTTEELNYFNTIHHKSGIVHMAIQKLYPKVEEDYTILLGVDSFLYLDNLKILDFINKYKIFEKNIALIMFKWINLSNVEYISNYNLLKNINEKKNIIKKYESHYFTLGKKDRVIHPDGTSHFYEIKNENDNIWCNDKVYEIDKTLGFWDIYNMFGANDNTRIGCIYHFSLRDIEDAMIKTFYYWNNSSTENKINFIKYFILTESNNLPSRFSYINMEHDNSIILNIITLNIDNDDNINDNKLLIKEILDSCDLTLEQLEDCIKKRKIQ